jgi:hypothetical protein
LHAIGSPARDMPREAINDDAEREGDIFRDDDSTTTARETTRRRDGRRAELQASVRYGLALARGATYCVDC